VRARLACRDPTQGKRAESGGGDGDLVETDHTLWRGGAKEGRGGAGRQPSTWAGELNATLRRYAHLTGGGRICGTLVAGGAVRSTLCLVKSVVYVMHSLGSQLGVTNGSCRVAESHLHMLSGPVFAVLVVTARVRGNNLILSYPMHKSARRHSSQRHVIRAQRARIWEAADSARERSSRSLAEREDTCAFSLARSSAASRSCVSRSDRSSATTADGGVVVVRLTARSLSEMVCEGGLTTSWPWVPIAERVVWHNG
jgi:hypothetical protein